MLSRYASVVAPDEHLDARFFHERFREQSKWVERRWLLDYEEIDTLGWWLGAIIISEPFDRVFSVVFCSLQSFWVILRKDFLATLKHKLVVLPLPDSFATGVDKSPQHTQSKSLWYVD